MKRLLFLISIIVFSAASVDAQRYRKKTSKNKKNKTEEVVEDPRIQIMTSATQKITFIDSVVVDKKDFIKYYKLSPEIGKILKSADFFHTKDTTESYIHLNGFGNKGYISQRKDSLYNLLEINLYGDEWTSPKELKGIADTSLYRSINYPYMMPDGYTFYFAATGNESIGGYDIFVTRYDSENNSFLKAENIGMPFNSTANDYMFVIDDLLNIGWFATDRNQPNNKVCIYTFIPNETRLTYNNDVSPERLKKFAKIHRISDTWDNPNEKDEAIRRINSNSIKLDSNNNDNYIVINDSIIYTNENDFKVEENKKKFKQLQILKQKLSTINKALEITRNYYASASDNEKATLNNGILKNEQEHLAIEKEIIELEKSIRQSENK